MKTKQSMVRSGAVVLAVVLGVAVGCGEDEEFPTGSADICVEPPESEEDAATYEIDGEVTVVESAPGEEFEELPEHCERSRMLRLEQDGDEWVVGYSVFDEEQRDIAPVPDLEEGDQVDVDMKVDAAMWNPRQSLAVSDDEGPILAIASNGGTSGERVDGLEVVDGADYGSRDTSCGTRVGYELVFQGDDDATLRMAEAGPVEVDGTGLTARNVSSYRLEDVRCEDVFGQTHWVVERE